MKVIELSGRHLSKRVRVEDHRRRATVEGTLTRIEHEELTISTPSLTSSIPERIPGGWYSSLTVGGVEVTGLGEDDATVEVLA